jgi:NitT/TauT family transport system permease protein
MTRPLTPANKTLERSAWTWQDGLLILAIFSLILAIVQTASQFSSDYNPNFKIETTLNVLPAYTAQTLLRMASAYFLSLLFTLVYAYSAYRFPLAAKILIPLLDILQSIPVLSFLPGVVLALVTLFPGQIIGVELASIILIFTGMTWNMTFSFYQSLSGIPRKLKEAAQIYRLNAGQQFWTLELPAGAIGLVWNSVMSVAGGWFFLIAIESFTLGDKNFNLPGLGSYLGKAANEGNFGAICWGLAVLIGVIIAIDFFIWQPLIAWVEKFKDQSVEATDVPQSSVLDFLRRSATLRVLKSRISPLGDSFDIGWARAFAPANLATRSRKKSRIGNWINWIFVSGFAAIVLWGTWEAVLLRKVAEFV